MTGLRATSYPDVRLRQCDENDEEALFRIFVASHVELLEAVSDWDEARQEALFRSQFQSRQSNYRSQYPNARFDVIVFEDSVIGNFYVAPGNDENLVVDINMLPDFRNRGIGYALLRDLMVESECANKSVSLRVMQKNPAVRLYQRLGFEFVEQQDVYQRMEWRPSRGTRCPRWHVN